jgi:hypothetical protein
MQRRVLAQRVFLSIAPRQGFVSMIALLQRGSALALAGRITAIRPSPRIADTRELGATHPPGRHPSGARLSPAHPCARTCPRADAGQGRHRGPPFFQLPFGHGKPHGGRLEEVLGLEHLDVRGNFFDSGGSSVLLPRSGPRYSRPWGGHRRHRNIPARHVREMARAVDGSAHSDNRDAPDLDGGERRFGKTGGSPARGAATESGPAPLQTSTPGQAQVEETHGDAQQMGIRCVHERRGGHGMAGASARPRTWISSGATCSTEWRLSGPWTRSAARGGMSARLRITPASCL